MDDNIHYEFRTVRGYQLMNQQEGQLTPAMEDYLEMTYRICLKNSYARVGQLSEMLNVKPSSVSKMICKLADLGYLKYERYEIILLTELGREVGAYLLNRHNTVEQFLKFIGSSDSLEETELIEHCLSPQTVLHLKTLLEFFNYNAKAQKDFEELRNKVNEL